MAKAKDYREFSEAWHEHVNQMYPLCFSLPANSASKLIVKLHEIEDLINEATRFVYGPECAVPKDPLPTHSDKEGQTP